MNREETVMLHLRSQTLRPDADGHNRWDVVNTEKEIRCQETVLLLCDVWDQHWSRGATERVASMVPRMNSVVQKARSRGIQIIHAPSDTMDFYEGTPARQRMIDAPAVVPPEPLEHADPPLPVDASDGGSDTGEKPWFKAWSRQHPGIEINQELDGITDDGLEVFNLMQQRALKNLLLMGVHTNMCVLGRSFAIKPMVRWGVPVSLLRDLTDSMYNPASSPYVSHEEGTRLIIEFIEKFWCPTISSEDLLQ